MPRGTTVGRGRRRKKVRKPKTGLEKIVTKPKKEAEKLVDTFRDEAPKDDLVDPAIIGALATRSERFSPFATQFLQQNLGPGQGLYGSRFDPSQRFRLPSNTPAQTFGTVLGSLGSLADPLGRGLGMVGNQTVEAFGGRPPFQTAQADARADERRGRGFNRAIQAEAAATRTQKSLIAESARLTGLSMFGDILGGERYAADEGVDIRPNRISVDVAMQLPFNPKSERMKEVFQNAYGVEGFETVQEFLDATGFEPNPDNPREWLRRSPATTSLGYGGGSYQSGRRYGVGNRGYGATGRGYSTTGLVNWRIGL